MSIKLSALIVSVVILAADLGSSEHQRQAAVVVEADALPGCAGLDCPPWPTPLDFETSISTLACTARGRGRGLRK